MDVGLGFTRLAYHERQSGEGQLWADPRHRRNFSSGRPAPIETLAPCPPIRRDVAGSSRLNVCGQGPLWDEAETRRFGGCLGLHPENNHRPPFGKHSHYSFGAE